MLFNFNDFIDPRLEAFIEESKQANAARAALNPQIKPDLTNLTTLNKIRINRNKTIEIPDQDILQRTVGISKRKVPIRIIYPKHSKIQGVFLEIHGGGFYIDSAARSDVSNSHLANALEFAVVSIDYRLAPESPWPAAPDDCAIAALWLVANAFSEFGTTNLFIGGASAGATLATTTMLRLRDKNLLQSFYGAVLQYGAYDLSGLTPGGRKYKDEYFIQAYAGKEDRTQPNISPLFANLHGFPPLLMLVGSLDILLEDNFAMFARLIGAGNEVDFRIYPESEHGFISRSTKMSAAATEDIYDWLKIHLKSNL